MKEYWSKAMLMNQKAKFDPVTLHQTERGLFRAALNKLP